MRRLSLLAIAFLFSLFTGFTQSAPITDSAYQDRKLRIEEVSFVSGYYSQDGNHAAVTGGIGSEQLTDVATEFKVKLAKLDLRGRRHDFQLSLGVDNYTSASSDKVDPATISSASHGDTRVYPALSWVITDADRGANFGLTASYSNEYDYQSMGFGATAGKSFNNDNQSIQLSANAFLDQYKILLPVELRPRVSEDLTQSLENGQREARNTYNASLVYSHVLNPRMQLAVIAEGVYQQGFLSTPFHRVYFSDGEQVRIEKLPDSRFKLPLALRFNWFIGDRFIVRTYYRYYLDNWDMRAHTFHIEVPVKVTPFFSLQPFYRYYTQTAANGFGPYGRHLSTDPYYTSDFDLSAFSSQYYGLGLRWFIPKGLARVGSLNFNTIELRVGHFQRDNNLSANSVSLLLKFEGTK